MDNISIEEIEIYRKARNLQGVQVKNTCEFKDELENSILVSDLSKLLIEKGVNIGTNKLFKCLRQDGYLRKSSTNNYNLPTTLSNNLGLFVVEKKTIVRGGKVIYGQTSRVTFKGQEYFLNKFVEEETFNVK